MPLVTLPDGIDMERRGRRARRSASGAEIFDTGAYGKHGLEMREGDCTVALTDCHFEANAPAWSSTPSTPFCG